MRQVWKTCSFSFFPKKSVVCCIISRKANKSAHKEGRKVFDLALLYLQTKTEESPDFVSGSRRLSRMQCSLPGGTFFLGKNIHKQFLAKLCGNQIDPLIYD